MFTPASLIPCRSCGCHAKTGETACPHCGARLRDESGRIPRTKVALLMGLTAAAFTGAACGSDEPPVQALYGVAITDKDGDGYLGDDCDNDDANIHPGALEKVGDGIDSNCNDKDDS